ncbi:MAG: glutamine-hydrolyzing carbamoyl-phosphate synthase small subunit [Spirochaetes bacterium]|nr:glutamine-hydrolyzing carbamoyl-phosphate synthase small subunit [Spirochaetota bacterium]
MTNQAALVLADGVVFYGESFGHPALFPDELTLDRSLGTGEVVFNTGMCGYHEILTDPSYAGQIVVMTYPLIGNYGSDPKWNESGPEKGVSRKAVKATGFVVKHLYRGPVPPGRISLHQFLQNQQVPGISGIDTRRLTLHLRDRGTPTGVIVRIPKGKNELSRSQLKEVVTFLNAFPPMEGRNLIGEVGTAKAASVHREGGKHIVLIDCGTKAGIVNQLVTLGVRVSILPSSVSLGEVLNLKPHGVLFSNGPGDPAVLGPQIELCSRLIGKVPVFGICLGHQLIALAMGGRTFKMPFGHHGVNHPVVDLRDGRVYVTSQNHGFAVDPDTLPAGLQVWMKNANDGTVEGLYHEELPVRCVQFHPEAHPGPLDTLWIFKEFMNYT